MTTTSPGCSWARSRRCRAWGANIVDERFAEGGDIDTAVTMLRFENGALGVVEMSRRSAWGYDIRTEVAGADREGRRRGATRRRPRRSRGGSASRATTTRASPIGSRTPIGSSSRRSSGRSARADSRARARGGARDPPRRRRCAAELAGTAAGPRCRRDGRVGRVTGEVVRHVRSRSRPGTCPRDHARDRRLAIPVVPDRRPRAR